MASLVTLASAALLAGASAPAAQAAGFGIATWEAGTCNSDTPECTYESPSSQFYTQAAGHPPIGLTGFEVNTAEGAVPGSKKPIGNVKDIRVDIPPGLSVNPQATVTTYGEAGQCTQAQFVANTCPVTSLVGTDEIFAYVGVLNLEHLSLPMYNLVPREGIPAEFGFELNAGAVETHVRIVGGFSWYKEKETSKNSGVSTGDYHEYFTIEEVPKEGLELVKTRLKFTGTAGNGTFITLPSTCTTQTSYLHISSYTEPENFQFRATLSGYPPKAISVSGCEHVPFGPSLSLISGLGETSPDRPDGVGVDVHVPQNPNGVGNPNSSDLQTASVTLPAGLTANPSAAHGLEGCTEAQIGIGTNNPIGCPEASRLGSATIETPVLPPGSLVGSIYLGKPSTGPITGPPFTVYIGVESKRYGVGIRLKGSTAANESTGQLTATFENNPPDPFEDFRVTFTGGARAPLANPLVCAPSPLSSLAPYTGQPAVNVLLTSPFSPGAGSVCSATAPFSLGQSTQSSSATAGAYTNYTFNLARGDGQQYLSQVKTTLPPGLVGAIPSVTLCGEPQAQAGTCSSASQIGTATVNVGAGPEPYPFTGPVFLTGPYNGAPYGLSIPVPAVAGPFNFGTVVTRAQINVDPHSGRVIATSNVPTIVKGVPLRLKSLSVAVNRPSFLFNPTNCGALATESTLASTFGATQNVSSPFQVGNCGALAFKPSFKVSTSARTSKLNGASLRVSITQPAHEANIHSVFTQLPLRLPSRLTTLQKACLEATFAANPFSCPAASKVGSATAITPVLPGKLTGPAFLVSHGGAAFPDLDIVLEGDGVRVILTGNTNIKKGITSSTFASIPDVPVSSFALTLPVGPYSLLTANGSLCVKPLVMPTTIVAQSGATIKQSTKISVSGCPVRIVSHKVVGHQLVLRVRTFAAGRVSVKGRSLRTTFKRVAKATTITIRTRLSRKGLSALARHRALKVRVRVGFMPKQKGGARSAASATVRFR